MSIYSVKLTLSFVAISVIEDALDISVWIRSSVYLLFFFEENKGLSEGSSIQLHVKSKEAA